jgi:hypothetical protein
LLLGAALLVAVLLLGVVLRFDLVAAALLLVLLSVVAALSVRFTRLPAVALVCLFDRLDLFVAAGAVLVFPTLSVVDLDVPLVFLGVAVVVLLLLVFTALVLLPFLEVDLVLTAVELRPVFLLVVAVVLPRLFLVT